MTTRTAKTARTARDLAAAGVVAPDRIAEIDAVAARFAVAVTPDLLALIDPGDPNDPIARQFVPAGAELEPTADERADPIGDAAHSPVDGVVHRYPDRVLLKLTQLCPVYCRFCFRREMIGPDRPGLDDPALGRALDYIQVILTGGDPLVLSDRRLGEVIAALNRIDHVGVIRIHTRVPVADPARVTPELVAALRGRAAVYVLLHCNHPRELSAAARAACARLVDAGIPMLSQTVLLRGVNDNAETMTGLMRSLVAARVKPHYLHHGDLAPGTRRFRTTIAAGQDLVRRLRGTVSGLCQPTYVLDIPGGHGKVPIGPGYLTVNAAGYAVADYRGQPHRYRDAVEPGADGRNLEIPPPVALLAGQPVGDPMGRDRLQERFQKAMGDVSKMFDRPRTLLEDAELDRDQKRRLLKQWEYDLREMQVAADENMPAPGAGNTGAMLQEVRVCLGKLGDADAPARSASHKQGG